MKNNKQDKTNLSPFQKIHPSHLQRDDIFYMKLAYNQAIDAWRHDEVPIGAIIEYKTKVIASAYNQVEITGDPTAHAEILAITQASRRIGDWRLNGASLYVPKEPCPMCSGAAIIARLSRVVYALSDIKMGCLGGATNINAMPYFNHRIITTKGVLETECLDLIQAFFKNKRKIVEQQVID